MHIVVFTPYYPTAEHIFSGTFVREQIRALARHHQITVIRPVIKPVLQFLAPMAPPQQDENWIVYFPHYILPRPYRFEYLTGLSQLYSAWTCARVIDWETVDLIHAHVAYPSGLAALSLAHRYRKPIVLTEHTGRFKAWVSHPFRRIAVHWTMKHMRKVIVVSMALQRRIEQEGIIANFAIVPNVVNTAVFHPPSLSPIRDTDTFHLLWVGGTNVEYILNKGAPELLQAVALASQKARKHIRLSLVVGGYAKTMCETLAFRLGIFEQCNFLGTSENLEIRNQMQMHDALILASHSESFGVVLIEAMACGKPVIATQCGGPSEIVTPETGLLIPPGNVEVMAEAIVQMSETFASYNPDYISMYANEKFSPDAFVKKLELIYAEACAYEK